MRRARYKVWFAPLRHNRAVAQIRSPYREVITSLPADPRQMCISTLEELPHRARTFTARFPVTLYWGRLQTSALY